MIYAAYQPYLGPMRLAKLEVSAVVRLSEHEAWTQIFDMLHSGEQCLLHLQLPLTNKILL
jgi:hypothetical protein